MAASNSNRKSRLIALGYNIYGTGLTRVMRTLMAELSNRYDIDVLGIGNKLPAYVEDGVKYHPTNTQGGGDAFGAFQVLDMARADPPDILFVLHDIWMFEYYSKMFQPLKSRTKLVGYMPLDGNIRDPRLALPLGVFDMVTVYTDWAADQLNQAFETLIAQGDLDRAPSVRVMLHGVDVTEFAPSPNLISSNYHPTGRQLDKRDVFGDADWVEDSFIVLNAARPDVRKRVDLTIEGFAKFAKGKPKSVKLCLHHAITEPETKDLLTMIDDLGIRDHVIYNPLSPGGGPLTEGDLARLYRACDVGINTAMGEGWGLVSFEHASTGAAQIVPDHTACSALWNDSTAEMIVPDQHFIPNFSPLEMGQVSADGVANALDRLYSDPDHCARLAKAGRTYVSQPEFQWSRIAEDFDRAFTELIS